MQKLNNEEEIKLKKIAVQIRKNVLRMIKAGGSGHIGGALSCTDIMTVLYFKILRIDPQNPTWPERDRFILSKGHAAPIFYTVLADAGYFDRRELEGLRTVTNGCPTSPSARQSLPASQSR